MNRRSNRSDSFSHSVSWSIAPQPSRREELPLVPCPSCGIAVKKFESRTEDNPGRIFYKCVNKNSRCKFWKWIEEYLTYLTNTNVDIPSIESELVGRLEAQLDNLTDEFKKKSQGDERKIEAVVASLDNIKMYSAISVNVIIALLVVVIALLIVVIVIQK
ncbi:hypothetical protein LUZ63_005237 [Rhynchospora breviuscula]|uniref:GRF-type domain-containing protein n=1 Tax=Rhynchospora breviuscula TaxID=2022672 RepID=A0A9Q0CN29_9POAL|nr:hypothetical protein LUZ63_005237 [Rhynchospora breviuscula]